MYYLMLLKDMIPPTISNLSPSNASYINNSTPTISAQVQDEVGDSGINLSSIKLAVDHVTVSHSYNLIHPQVL